MERAMATRKDRTTYAQLARAPPNLRAGVDKADERGAGAAEAQRRRSRGAVEAQWGAAEAQRRRSGGAEEAQRRRRGGTAEGRGSDMVEGFIGSARAGVRGAGRGGGKGAADPGAGDGNAIVG